MNARKDRQTAAFQCRDGGRLAYSISGQGEPVVFIHGFGVDAAMWDPQWSAFGQDYRAIRYDLRGYGHSTLPDGPYTHADDLLALLDALDARPAQLVGLSMGAQVALRIALQEPAAVRSLTLVDGALEGFRWSDAWSQRWRATTAAARCGDVAEAKRVWLDHELFAPARKHPHVAAALAAMVGRYSGWHWWHGDPGTTPARPAIELLATVSVPTLVVVGELDLPDFQEIARRFAADIPSAKLRVIAGAGHMSNLEASAEFNELLLMHLRAAADHAILDVGTVDLK